MSAYLCDNDTFDMLASAACQWNVTAYIGEQQLVGRTDAAVMGSILQAENVRSVNYRYNEQDTPTYSFRRVDYSHFTAVEVLAAIACVRYQSCECPDYSASAGAAVLNAIERAAIRALPGYEDAPREWRREHGEARHRAAVVAFYEAKMTAGGVRL